MQINTLFDLPEFLDSGNVQTMQRALNYLLKKLPFVYVYQDDILLFSGNHEHHLRHFQQLFIVLHSSKLQPMLVKEIFGH